MTPKRRRAWVWIAAAALLVLAPAGWLGAEYALDNAHMEAVRAELDKVRSLMDRAANAPDESGESDACASAGSMLAQMQDPPWWRHVAFSLLEEQQVQAASRRLAEMKKVAAERRANRAWWTEQAAAIDAALVAPGRTIPDLLALRDSVEASAPPHGDAGGLAPDARKAALDRIDAESASLTDAQDRLLRECAAAAELLAQAMDAASLDAALARVPGADAQDLNPPELDEVRERINARADAIRAEFAFRASLESSIAGALSSALALDPETATSGDAYAIVVSIEAMVVPDGARYASLGEAKSQALEAARRRVALLEARDRDRAWLDDIAVAAPKARTARDAQALLARLQEDPPGGSELESISRRAGEIGASLRSALQTRRDRSRRWREDLAAAVDTMVTSRSLQAFAASSERVAAMIAQDEEDPSSSEDAQAERAALMATRTTAARLVRQELAPVVAAARQSPDPRRPSPEVVAALSPDSPLASVEEAKELLDAIRAGLAARLAEYEAFDGAIDRARRAMEDGNLCAAADALASAAPRDAEQEWIRTDLRGALGELAVEMVESLVLGEGSLGPGSLSRLESIAQCDALAACAPDASRMALRVWQEARIEADRTLWEECRRTARAALDRRDAATYIGTLSRYIASRGAMQLEAAAARDAFAVPVASVIASEFRWGDSACAPVDVISDITITVDGDAWSGPIPTGMPGQAVRLSREWTVRSAADLVVASASGVCPCDEPQPFAGLGEIALRDRRFGASLEIPCHGMGGAAPSVHALRLKVVPSPAWTSSLKLPPWRSTGDAPDAADVQADESDPAPRPESDMPEVTEPSQEAEPR